jgi:cytochrome c oxidase assembly protein subunit 11
MSAHTANVTLVKRLLALVVTAFFLGFALVPLYEIACEKVFGIKLDDSGISVTQAQAMTVDPNRKIRVRFDATVNSKLNWGFAPKHAVVEVHPGQLTQAWFTATNNSDHAVVGNAVPSVAPNTASMFFNKTECFCFTEQMLGAGETRDMPVVFVVDPAIPADVREVTLGYAFFLNDTATKQAAARLVTAKAAGES